MAASNALLVYLRVPADGETGGLPIEKPRAIGTPLKLTHPRSESSGNDDDGDADGSSDGAAPVCVRTVASLVETRDGSKKKLRKPTYAARKEEATRLAEELRLLEARAELLRRQLGIPSDQDFQTLEKAECENRVMEEAWRTQMLSLCGVQSELSRHMRGHFSSPLKKHIRLGTDRDERRAALMEIRSEKLHIAARCLLERYRGIDERRAFSDVQEWTTEKGDFCFHRADVVHFVGVKSVRDVFDAVTFFFANLEISVSEAIDQLTLREDIDDVGLCTSNHRLLSSTCHGLELETNVVSFNQFSEGARPGDEFGLLALDCVDEDALFPYCTSERVRKDMTCALSVSSFRRPMDPLVIRSAADGSVLETEFVVVLRRCAYISIHKPQFPVSAAALEDLRANLAVWGDVMTTTMNERLYGRARPPL